MTGTEEVPRGRQGGAEAQDEVERGSPASVIWASTSTRNLLDMAGKNKKRKNKYWSSAGQQLVEKQLAEKRQLQLQYSVAPKPHVPTTDIWLERGIGRSSGWLA